MCVYFFFQQIKSGPNVTSLPIQPNDRQLQHSHPVSVSCTFLLLFPSFSQLRRRQLVADSSPTSCNFFFLCSPDGSFGWARSSAWNEGSACTSLSPSRCRWPSGLRRNNSGRRRPRSASFPLWSPHPSSPAGPSMKRKEIVSALLYVRCFDCAPGWSDYLVGCVCLHILLVDLPGSGRELRRRRLLVVLAGHPEVYVLLAELWLQETGEDGAASWCRYTKQITSSVWGPFFFLLLWCSFLYYCTRNGWVYQSHLFHSNTLKFYKHFFFQLNVPKDLWVTFGVTFLRCL